MARTSLTAEQLAQVLGPDADKAFLQMLMQNDEDASPSGLVAPKTAGDGLHNIGVYMNSALRSTARKTERHDLMDLLGKSAAISADHASRAFTTPDIPSTTQSPAGAVGNTLDFKPAPMGSMAPPRSMDGIVSPFVKAPATPPPSLPGMPKIGRAHV